MFLPTKAAARNALHQFLPNAGLNYAANRNYDQGPKGESSVSKMSPWIRLRMLTEWDVISSVLEQHSAENSSKFTDEVCWRTYWKGWLEMRPSIWSEYLSDRAELLQIHDEDVGYLEAVEGRTGIDCFDTWNEELIRTNYLHNHARMWYASIWVHTLKLPWQLGADWFLRHLLDGDVASNTLSWRWVAGLHTRGKTYLARPDNIRKYTNNRYRVTEALASEPVQLEERTLPKPKAIEPVTGSSDGLRIGLIVTDDDLSAANWIAKSYTVKKIAGLFCEATYKAHHIEKQVIEFRRAALSGAVEDDLLKEASEVIDWLQDNNLDGITTPAPIEGFNKAMLQCVREELENSGKSFYTLRHWWDEMFYPHATHGFFRFKQAIPKVLSKISQLDSFTKL